MALPPRTPQKRPGAAPPTSLIHMRVTVRRMRATHSAGRPIHRYVPSTGPAEQENAAGLHW
jgi:hypothetical protein